MATKTLELTQGDTWTLDAYVEGAPPLAGGATQPLDLSGAVVELAIAVKAGDPPKLHVTFDVPPSATAEVGLARLIVGKEMTQGVAGGRYVYQLRVTKGDLRATVGSDRMKVLPAVAPP